MRRWHLLSNAHIGKGNRIATNSTNSWIAKSSLELIKVVVQTNENDDKSPGDGEVHYFIPRIRFRFTLPSGEL